MQRIAVIGLGRFGARLAGNLAQAGCEVIAIDKDILLVETIRDDVTLAIALDATDEQALRAHGLDRVDAVVVGIGDNFEATALSTVLLKQLGVPYIISRAMTRTAAQILTRIGADAVVSPEDESADRWTHKLLHPDFLSQFSFGEGYSVVEMRTPTGWIGKTLMELNVRAQTGLLVIAVKQPRATGEAVTTLVQPNQPLHAEQILVLAGKDADLEKLSSNGGKSG